MALTPAQWATITPPAFTKDDKVMMFADFHIPGSLSHYVIADSLTRSWLEGDVAKYEHSYRIYIEGGNPSELTEKLEVDLQTFADGKSAAQDKLDSWPI